MSVHVYFLKSSYIYCFFDFQKRCEKPEFSGYVTGKQMSQISCSSVDFHSKEIIHPLVSLVFVLFKADPFFL